MAKKRKLTAAERLVDEQMLAMLEWAADQATKWHRIGKLDDDSQGGRAAREARCH
jgi:hypothetical protein